MPFAQTTPSWALSQKSLALPIDTRSVTGNGESVKTPLLFVAS
jgi:hypothetical protein